MPACWLTVAAIIETCNSSASTSPARTGTEATTSSAAASFAARSASGIGCSPAEVALGWALIAVLFSRYCFEASSAVASAFVVS